MKKIKHVLLSCVLLATVFGGTGCGKERLTKADIPDYSGYDHQFDFFGYHSAHDGYYYIDDVKYSVNESFLTKEQYQMYKDAGMTMFYPQSILKIRGDSGSRTEPEGSESYEAFYADRKNDWEQTVKPEIDKLMEIGMDCTILYDEDLSWLGLNEPNRVDGDGSRDDEPVEPDVTPAEAEKDPSKVDMTDGEREARGLIGEYNDQFATEEELDAQVEKYLSIYAGYPGVGGVCLADEPKNVWYKSYADLYNSIKRVSAKNNWDLYISFNLNPLNLNEYVYQEYYPYVEGTQQESTDATDKVPFEDGFIRYKQYITNYMEAMQPDYIRYDDYPLRNGYLSATYIPCLQYVAGEARDRNIEFHMVTQSFEMSSNGSPSMRPLTELGAKWLNNMLLGFGVTEISYFTYFTRTEDKSDGESFTQYPNSSFVNIYGQKTKIYDFMQKIMGNNQKFAPTVLQFKYKKSGVFAKMPMSFNGDHIQYVEKVNQTTYELLDGVTVNKECAMVNEMYDAENDRYMYMAMNIIDPDEKGSAAYQTITLDFKEGYKYAVVYRDGESLLYRLNDGKLDIKGAPGEASFVIPF